jgi:hypothetical protein
MCHQASGRISKLDNDHLLVEDNLDTISQASSNMPTKETTIRGNNSKGINALRTKDHTADQIKIISRSKMGVSVKDIHFNTSVGQHLLILSPLLREQTQTSSTT